MEYLCPSCGASEILYQGHLKCCPYCGCTKLYFSHFASNNFPHKNTPFHRVLVDCETGKALETDLCDMLREVNHE